MNYLKDNILILLLVFLTILSEVFHLLFVGIPFKGNYDLSVPVYYLTSQFGLVNFIPALVIFYLIPHQKKASKSIAFGLVIWNCKEMFDEIMYITSKGKITDVLEINESFWMQIVFILVVIFLSGYGYARWKY
jgi:hypothetical protein